MLNGSIQLHGDSVLISDIGPQPDDHRDHRLNLIGVTTSVSTACCRGKDNNGFTNDTSGSVG